MNSNLEYGMNGSIEKPSNLFEKESGLFDGLEVENYSNGITVSNEKIVFPRKDLEAVELSSTLLIPEKYLELLQNKKLEHGGLRGYVAYLLSKYKLHIANGLIPGYSNLTTKYQEQGQNLEKIAFRPFPADWAELKLYRVAFGMSISAFFVYLLIADSVDFVEVISYYLGAVGIPCLPNWNMCAKVYLCEKRSRYTTVFQYRKSRYD